MRDEMLENKWSVVVTRIQHDYLKIINGRYTNVPTFARPENTMKAVIVINTPTWSQFQLATCIPWTSSESEDSPEDNVTLNNNIVTRKNRNIPEKCIAFGEL